MVTQDTSSVETPTVQRSCGTVLRDYDGDLDRENFELIAKVVYLITVHAGWSEDGTFTFPDGETWGKLEEIDDDEQ
jgi:hypothetical protein